MRVAIGTSGGPLFIQRADGTTRWAGLAIDTGRKVWTTQTAEDGAVLGDYRVERAGAVTLDGTFGTDHVHVVLTPQGESRLLGRGFHWINEYPFNR